MSSTVRVSLTVILLVALMVPLAGCGGAAPTESATPPATDGTAGVLDGASLVESLCTTCHTRERIDSATMDLAEWQATINRMITQNGAKISTEQQSAIAIYLSNR